jgi:hypothetical protein
MTPSRLLGGYSPTTRLVLPNLQGAKVWLALAKSLTFRVETTDENVIVTLPGTGCMVNYRKAVHGLAVFHMRGDADAPIHDIHFLARAWQLANDKARELAWIV